jgi:hypothetical protein
VIFAELDLVWLRRHQRKGTVRNWEDRRTDLYRIRYRAGEADREA